MRLQDLYLIGYLYLILIKRADLKFYDKILIIHINIIKGSIVIIIRKIKIINYIIMFV